MTVSLPERGGHGNSAAKSRPGLVDAAYGYQVGNVWVHCVPDCRCCRCAVRPMLCPLPPVVAESAPDQGLGRAYRKLRSADHDDPPIA